MEDINKEATLKETLAEVARTLTELKEQKKVKTWNLPWSARTISKKKRKDGWVVFLNIGENKWGTFIKAPIEDGVAMVNGIPHVVDPSDIIMLKKNLGLVIQPQWSIKPFSPNQNAIETEEAGNGTKGWEYIMNYVYKTQLKAKKSFNAGIVILIGLAVIAGGYYLMKSGAFS